MQQSMMAMLMNHKAPELTPVGVSQQKSQEKSDTCFAKTLQSSLQQKQEGLDTKSALETDSKMTNSSKPKKGVQCRNLDSDQQLENGVKPTNKENQRENSEENDTLGISVVLPGGQQMPVDQFLEMFQDIDIASVEQEIQTLLGKIKTCITQGQQVIDLKALMQEAKATAPGLQQVFGQMFPEHLKNAAQDINKLKADWKHEDVRQPYIANVLHPDAETVLQSEKKTQTPTTNMQPLSSKGGMITPINDDESIPVENAKNKDTQQIDLSLSKIAAKSRDSQVLNMPIQKEQPKMIDVIPKMALVQQNQPVTEELTAIQDDIKPSTESVIQQIIAKASLATKNGLHEMKIHLKPEFLGELTLKVSVENGMVTAKFFTPNQQVKEILEGQLVQLRQTLSEQGLKVQQVEVFSGNDGGLLHQHSFGSHAYNQQGSRQHHFFSQGHYESQDVPWEEETGNPLNYLQSGMQETVDYRI